MVGPVTCTGSVVLAIFAFPNSMLALQGTFENNKLLDKKSKTSTKRKVSLLLSSFNLLDKTFLAFVELGRLNSVLHPFSTSFKIKSLIVENPMDFFFIMFRY